MRWTIALSALACSLALLAPAGCGPKEDAAPPVEAAAPPAPPPLSGMIIGTVQAASVEKSADGTAVKVCAIGKAPTTGYSNPRLEMIPVTAPPADGVYEFNLMVDGPIDPIVMPKEEEFKAQMDWTNYPADALKGVRVKATYGEPAVGMIGGKSAC